MARAYIDSHGNARIRWMDPSIRGKRAVLYVGPVGKREANVIASHITDLVLAKKSGLSPSPETKLWLSRAPRPLLEKLASHELIEPPGEDHSRKTLVDLYSRFKALHYPLKASSTIANYERAFAALNEYFKASTKLSEIDGEAALAFRAWLLAPDRKPHPLKATSAGIILRQSKQFFLLAKREGWLNAHPFTFDIPATVPKLGTRQRFFVSGDLFSRIIAKVEDPNGPLDESFAIYFRAMLFLGRYGGLRLPSELKLLRWDDVDESFSQFRVSASKTSEPGSPDARFVPLFPEVKNALDTLKATLKVRQQFGIDPDAIPDLIFPPEKVTLVNSTLHRRFRAVLEAISEKPWPRLLHNLRASRQTELYDAGLPDYQVCFWLGNSPGTAWKSYLMLNPKVMEEQAKRWSSRETDTHWVPNGIREAIFKDAGTGFSD